MSLQRIRTRIGAVIAALALLAGGLGVGVAANQASAAPAPAAAAAAPTSGSVTMVTPCRIADSRNGNPLSQFTPWTTEYLGITGSCNVPYNVAGAVLDITVVPSPWSNNGGGYLTLWPDDAGMPTVSQVSYNWYTVTTEVTVKLSPWGWIGIFNGSVSGADVIVDVAAYIN